MPSDQWSPELSDRYSALLTSTLQSSGTGQPIGPLVGRFADALDGEEESAEKYFWLGAAWSVEASVDKSPEPMQRAVAAFERSLEIDPSQSNTYAKLLGAYLSLSDEAGARRTAVRWAEVDDDLPEEARVWAQGQKSGKTMVCRGCGQAVAYDSGLVGKPCPICHESAGWVSVEPGTEDPRARAFVEEAVRHAATGRANEAIAAFQNAHEADPSDATILHNIGTLQMESGDLESARTSFTKALEIDPSLEQSKRALELLGEGAMSAPQSQNVAAAAAVPAAESAPGADWLVQRVDSLLGWQGLEPTARVLLLARTIEAALNSGQDGIAQRYWPYLGPARESLRDFPGNVPQVLSALDERLSAGSAAISAGAGKGFAAECATAIAEAAAKAATGPAAAAAALRDVEARIDARRLPGGRGAARCLLVRAWAAIDRGEAFRRLGKAKKVASEVVAGQNALSPLSEAEWALVVESLDPSSAVGVVRHVVAVNAGRLHLPDEFAVQVCKGIAIDIPLGDWQKLLAEWWNLCEALVGASETALREGFREVYLAIVKAGATSAFAKNWTSRYAATMAVVHMGATRGLIDWAGLQPMLGQTPEYLRNFVIAQFAAETTGREDAQRMYRWVYETTAGNSAAVTWYAVALVHCGEGPMALDLARSLGPDGRGLRVQVCRTWLVKEFGRAAASITRDDVAGSPLDESLHELYAGDPVAALRSWTYSGTGMLPGALWVNPAPEQKKGFLSGGGKKAPADIVKEYVGRNPLFGAVDMKVRDADKTQEFVKSAGEMAYGLVDAVLEHALLLWAEQHPDEVDRLLRGAWRALWPPDNAIFVDWFWSAILDRTKLLGVVPDVLVGDFAAWLQTTTGKARTWQQGNQTLSAKIPDTIPAKLCLIGAQTVAWAGQILETDPRYRPRQDGLRPGMWRKDAIIAQAVSGLKLDGEIVEAAARLYAADKDVLDMAAPAGLGTQYVGSWQRGVIEASAQKIGALLAATRRAERANVAVTSEGQLCDICNREITAAEATTFSAEEFRRIVARGYFPQQELSAMAGVFGTSTEDLLAGWRTELVANTTTGWMLCPTCAERAAAYR